MLNELAAASYRRDLGDGLTLRWSTTDDAEGVAQLMGMIWRNSADEPINVRMVEAARQLRAQINTSQTETLPA